MPRRPAKRPPPAKKPRREAERTELREERERRLISTAPHPPERQPNGGPMRRCLVARESLPCALLVRFVVAPDGTVIPDVEGRAPGRGMWLQARRDVVEKARASGLFARSVHRAVIVAPDLADRVEALLARRCLDILGFARRAGEAVAGFEKVRGRLRRGEPAVLLSAVDSAAGGRDKLGARAGGCAKVALFTSDELGAVFGRERVMHVAIAAGRLADRMVAETGRLAGFRTRPAVGKLH
jgi:uncharacterized protein